MCVRVCVSLSCWSLECVHWQQSQKHWSLNICSPDHTKHTHTHSHSNTILRRYAATAALLPSAELLHSASDWWGIYATVVLEMQEKLSHSVLQKIFWINVVLCSERTVAPVWCCVVLVIHVGVTPLSKMSTTINVHTGHQRTSSWRQVKMMLIDGRVNHCWIPVLTWRKKGPGINDSWNVTRVNHLVTNNAVRVIWCLVSRFRISKGFLTPACLHNVGCSAQLYKAAVDLLF